jgi:hypothetical protein
MARTARAQIRLKVTKPWAGVVLSKVDSTMPKHCMVRDVDDPFEIESDLSVMPDADAAADAVVPGTRNAVSSRRVIRVLRSPVAAPFIAVVSQALTREGEKAPPTTVGISCGQSAKWAWAIKEVTDQTTKTASLTTSAENRGAGRSGGGRLYR